MDMAVAATAVVAMEAAGTVAVGMVVVATVVGMADTTAAALASASIGRVNSNITINSIITTTTRTTAVIVGKRGLRIAGIHGDRELQCCGALEFPFCPSEVPTERPTTSNLSTQLQIQPTKRQGTQVAVHGNRHCIRPDPLVFSAAFPGTGYARSRPLHRLTCPGCAPANRHHSRCAGSMLLRYARNV